MTVDLLSRSSQEAPRPTTTTRANTPGLGSAPAPVYPIKQERPFPSGSPGVTTWYGSSSLEDISSPAPSLNPSVGDLYVHTNRVTTRVEVWLYGMERNWECVTDVYKVYHPVIPDRVLSMRANGTPSWITAASFTTIQGRKERGRM